MEKSAAFISPTRSVAKGEPFVSVMLATWRLLLSVPVVVLLLQLFSHTIVAQELEVRRWNHLPINRSFGTLNFAHSDGEITFDPVLQIQNATVDIDTTLFGFVHSFEFLGRSSRFEIRQAWKTGTWSGTVRGAPATEKREGLDDTLLRFAISLYGAPPLSGEKYVNYRKSQTRETIVGAALSMQLPTGNYRKDKLINLGTNRFTFRPQIGLQHKLKNWTFEGTAVAAFYTENDDLLLTNRLSSDPAYSFGGSIEYDFSPRLWVAASAGLNVGGETQINGLSQDDRRKDVGWALSVGYLISPKLSFKITYIDIDNREPVGNASQSLSVGFLTSW